MKILILNWRDFKHPLAGGAELALVKHAEFWQKKGAKITWFCSNYPGAKGTETINGITYLRKGSQYTVHLFAFFYLVKRTTQFDIIIDNFHFIPFFTPFYCNKTKIIAFIHEVAGKVWYKNLPKIPAFIGYSLEPWYFKLYKKTPFITVSNSTKLELTKMGIPEQHIVIIPNGVTYVKNNRYKKEKDSTILFLGRLSDDKGISDALQTFNLLYTTDKKMQFWIVGKEEKKGIYNQLISNFSTIASVTKYWGYVDEKKKFELLRRSWLLLHPSVKEGWGLTVIEAASQGTPTVGYDVEGLRDSILSHKTGILTKKNPTSLAIAVQSLLKNNELYQKMCKEAFQWSEKFDWEKSVKQSWGFIKKQNNQL
jgi:glycosyltransferase involved in cell wall biosynthesis